MNFLKQLWHPLKLAGVFYVVADGSLFLGGIGYDNALLAASGICGMLGNGVLLIGGSGAKKVDSRFLQKIAPYAERLSFSFYVLQNLAFAASCVLMYNVIIWSGVIGAVIGILGSLSGIFIKSRLMGLLPYQIAGCLWLLASVIGFIAGLDVHNIGIIIANIMLVLGAVCVMVSHRAEFKKEQSQ